MQWEWHDFEDETEVPEPDDLDPYLFGDVEEPQIAVAREFFAGRLSTGHRYTVGFTKIDKQSVLESFLGETQYSGKQLAIPESGAWIVAFDLADGENDYAHVQIDFRAKKDLVTGVACAVYDHYNVTKAGLYFWIAARDELLGIYDTALGFDVDRDIRLKSIPMTSKFNRLGSHRRGYAIVTKYY